MKEVKRYQCGFCKKLAAYPETIRKHERECLHNPEGKNCYLCELAVLGGYIDDPRGGSSWEKDLPYCSYHELPLKDLRYEGITAQTCESFTKSEKPYYYREGGESVYDF